MLKKLFKNIICKIYYKYYFTEESQANLFITYYLPGIVNNGPAGTYIITKINQKKNEIEPLVDFIKYQK